MCLIAIKQTDALTIVLSNRDEAWIRDSTAMGWHSGCLYGVDTANKGTWLGLSHDKRFAALTNILSDCTLLNAPSRGKLVCDFIHGSLSAETYFAGLASHAQEYNPFTLVAGDLDGQLYYFDSLGGPASIRLLERNELHLVVNSPLGTAEAWPKVRAMRKLVAGLPSDPTVDEMMALLDTRLGADCLTLAADPTANSGYSDGTSSEGDDCANDTFDFPGSAKCPDKWRRVKRSIYLEGDIGTRASTVIKLGGDEAVVCERSYSTPDDFIEQKFSLELPNAGGLTRVRDGAAHR